MIVVFHICNRDAEKGIQNLRWWSELDPGGTNLFGILAHDDVTNPNLVAAATEEFRKYFKSWEVFNYPAPVTPTWPAAPNHAWQNIARFIAYQHNKPWFFIEADAIPVKSGWLDRIYQHYLQCGKPFLGHIVHGVLPGGHMNGVGVYPPVVAEYTTQAFMVETSAWDVVMSTEARHQMAHAEWLFQHFWAVNPATNDAWNGSGPPPSFKSQQDLVRWCNLDGAIFHRCKDGSLIDQLRIFRKDPSKAMVPDLIGRAEPIKVEQQVLDRDYVETEVKEPSQAPNPEPVQAEPGRIEQVTQPSRQEPNHPTVPVPAAFKGQAEILIVTYGRPTKRQGSGEVVSDADWFKYCMAAIEKYAAGFVGVTVAIPRTDFQYFAWLNAEPHKLPINMHTFEEQRGKGMIQHMAMMAGADKLVQKGTTHVLHMDADCIIKEPIHPSDYFYGDKPVYVVRTYDSLMDPESKVVSDCVMWKEPTRAQLGFDPQMYTMCRHPSGFPITFYPRYRKHIEQLHGKPFIEYMMEGKSDWPQTRMDFTAMGAFAWEAMRDDFAWWDVSDIKTPRPPDKMKTYWSHGGITPAIKDEIEGFLK